MAHLLSSLLANDVFRMSECAHWDAVHAHLQRTYLDRQQTRAQRLQAVLATQAQRPIVTHRTEDAS